MTEFEKWWKDAFCDIPTITDDNYDYYKGTKQGWKAALRMIKYKGVISNYELASKIIKDELKE